MYNNYVVKLNHIKYIFLKNENSLIDLYISMFKTVGILFWKNNITDNMQVNSKSLVIVDFFQHDWTWTKDKN